MKIDFDRSEISIGALLECFSIPSNKEYLLTEVGIAINFYQNLAVDKNLPNPYQLQVKDSKKTHTLFSMFSNSNQKQFIKNHIPSAKLVISNAEESTKNWEFECEFICLQFNNVPITLSIKLNITKNAFEIVSVSAESTSQTRDELLSLPLILMLIQP